MGTCRHAVCLSLSHLGHLGFVMLVLAAALVQFILSDDDFKDGTSPEADPPRPAAVDMPPSSYLSGGFDRRKMLQPSFGQTFKAKRVGACQEE
ncbi:hypothetical protein GUITHDRAFT_117490 [Guillardia theta CCMP2712]|uniref:Uncharacterized protein n=1 Tax=Guillardia theta (strain CCMP2712) TaxID=905079 RepID=L1IJH8_GUITC|nr:hypothetical protein GUITHDRAFT_117490 [Guillardia theta CCMP2712]EKX36381.1 hypothetical protein GUITHDRAFT_117490 [Guillardia theta CCMP2712]|eukprot:XP_005823361.1 hypothetical protein GUITHDRAFT_117490 [Guillardia theta CCMP2712]